jgi:hypothetical protein
MEFLVIPAEAGIQPSYFLDSGVALAYASVPGMTI